MNVKKISILFVAIALVIIGCQTNHNKKRGKLNVVSTTTMIHDIVKNIGGDKINAKVIMGAGVDPHLYKASASDVNTFHNANVIFYNGLHLEGKLDDLFEKMEKSGKSVYAVSEHIPETKLISSEAFASNYDPHIWFDISLWKIATKTVLEKLEKEDPANKAYYHKNYTAYIKKLDVLHQKISALIQSLDASKRILVTAHDAFNYFGKAYDFEVVGLQGISTVAEAGVKDVQNLTQLIVDRKVKAVFVESSVPKKNIEALQEAVKAKGFSVDIGGELFSDALGSVNTPEETYDGMFLYNVSTIVKALK